MSIDICRLTEDILPLYVDDLLSPETRRGLEAHAASCPACARLLAGGAAPPPPPAPAPLPEPVGAELSARRLMGRLRRLLFYGLIGLVLLLVGVGTLSYQVGHLIPRPQRDLPWQVGSSLDLARKVVPGWERAAESGQLVALDLTREIPGTQASITFEQAWYGERESYLLYTVRAPRGEHLALANPFTRPKGVGNWPQPHNLGAFSDEGYHQVLVLTHDVLSDSQLTLLAERWVRITPKTDWDAFAKTLPVFQQMSIDLPVPPSALAERVESHRLNQAGSWLGRELALEELQIGLREVRLTALVRLPEGERAPGLGGALIFGDEERRLQQRAVAEPTGRPGEYRVTVVADPPTQWPAPVSLRLEGLAFTRTQPLIMELPWNRYRGPERTELKPAERPAVLFYDSRLEFKGLYHGGRGLQFDIIWPDKAKPHVRYISGGDQEVAVVGPNGHTITNLGGGYGPIEGRHEFWGINFDEADEAKLEGAEVLTVRVGRPRAAMSLEETWKLELAGQ